MLDSTVVWSECARMEFVYHLYTVFVMCSFHTQCHIISHTMWNRKNKSDVQCMCIGSYLYTYLIYSEKDGALLEC